MRQFLLSAFIKFFIAASFLFGAWYGVNHSNFYYLFIPNIFLLIGLSFLSEAILTLLFSLSKKLANRKKGIIGTSRASFIVLFIADLTIGFTGIMQTYSERSDGKYFSISTQEKLDSWYWAHTPNTTITNHKKEFLYTREVNSLGISEKEIAKEKGGKFRILAIGDSFTEGVGLNYEETWVKRMESRWKSLNIESINGGIGGSDPVYSFVLFRDKLVGYQPDLVILTINSTDVIEVIGRGGFERFHPDGTAGKEPPSWEWIYACNHLFRLTLEHGFGYNQNLVRHPDAPENKERAVAILKEAVVKLKNLCAEKEAKLLVVLQPSIQNFNKGKHTPFFGQKELARFMEIEKINYLDVTPVFKQKGKSISDYYYPIDTHFNKKGYALFGNTVYEKIEELGFLD